MARARLIKPSFFTNDRLSELPVYTRLLFIGLWTLADREGRLEDRPKRIKVELFPYDNVNVEKALTQLQECEFILRYEAGQACYIQVVAFTKHQSPHPKEIASSIPPPAGHSDSRYPGGVVDAKTRAEVFARDGSACLRCGSTTDLTVDHVVPQYEGGSHDSSNLQTLCRGCNAAKGRRMHDSGMTHASTMHELSNPTFSGTSPAGSSDPVLPIPLAIAGAEPPGGDAAFKDAYGSLVTAYGGEITRKLADEFTQIAEDYPVEAVTGAIRECRAVNKRCYPSNVLKFLVPPELEPAAPKPSTRIANPMVDGYPNHKPLPRPKDPNVVLYE